MFTNRERGHSRKGDVMCMSPGYVSAYLQRPLRNYDQALREQAERPHGDVSPGTVNDLGVCGRNAKESDHADHRR